MSVITSFHQIIRNNLSVNNAITITCDTHTNMSIRFTPYLLRERTSDIWLKSSTFIYTYIFFWCNRRSHNVRCVYISVSICMYLYGRHRIRCKCNGRPGMIRFSKENFHYLDFFRIRSKKSRSICERKSFSRRIIH